MPDDLERTHKKQTPGLETPAGSTTPRPQSYWDLIFCRHSSGWHNTVFAWNSMSEGECYTDGHDYFHRGILNSTKEHGNYYQAAVTPDAIHLGDHDPVLFQHCFDAMTRTRSRRRPWN